MLMNIDAANDEPIDGGSRMTTPRRVAVPTRVADCCVTRRSVVLRLMFRPLMPVIVTIEKKPGFRPLKMTEPVVNPPIRTFV